MEPTRSHITSSAIAVTSTGTVIPATAANAAAAPATRKKAAQTYNFVVLPNEIWRLIFSYTLEIWKPTRFAADLKPAKTTGEPAKASDPKTPPPTVIIISSTTPMTIRKIDWQFRTIVDRMTLDHTISYLDIADSVASVASSLDPKKYEAQITSLKEWDARRVTLTAQRQSLMEGADPLPLLATARILKFDLVDYLSRIPAIALSGIPVMKTVTRLQELQKLSLMKVAFESKLKAVAKDPYSPGPNDKLNFLSTISDVELDGFPEQLVTHTFKDDRLKRISNLYEILENYINMHMNPDRAMTLLSNEGRELLPAQQVTLSCKLVDLLLEQQRASAWDLLLPPDSFVTEAEVKAADQALAKVEAHVKSGDIPSACQIARTTLLETNPLTGSLRFPDQCLRLFSALVNNSDQKPKIVTTKSNVAGANTPKDDNTSIYHVLIDLVRLLPHSSEKEELLRKAQKEPSFTQNAYLERLLDTSLEELKKREIRLYKLASVLIKDGDFARGIEIANLIRSPHLIFGCLDCLLDYKLDPEQTTEFLRLAQRLPDEHKYILIKQATAKERDVLAVQLEQGFNRLAMKQQAERELGFVISTQKLLETIIAKKDLTKEDVDRILLVAWSAPIGYAGKTIVPVLTNILGIDKITSNSLLQTAVNSLARFDELRQTKNTLDLKNVKALPVLLQVRTLKDLKQFQKYSNECDEQISQLQKEIESKGKDVIANAEAEYLKIFVVSPENPYMSAKEVAEVLNTEFLVQTFVRNRFSDLFNSEFTAVNLRTSTLKDLVALHCKDDELLTWQISKGYAIVNRDNFKN